MGQTVNVPSVDTSEHMAQGQSDLAILFYTANLVDESFAARIRDHLERARPHGVPLISISQKPMNFGDENIMVGTIGASARNVYLQILEGARAAQSRYVAMAEDDCLYTSGHFGERPPDNGTFWYNKNRWWLEPKTFRWRNRSGMHTCICNRELLVETLDRRLREAKWDANDRVIRRSWAEPGRYEQNLGLPRPPMVYGKSRLPVVTVNHRDSLGGRREIGETDRYEETLTPWGRARDLWRELYGER